MSLSYLGEFTIGGALPGAQAAAVAGAAGINAALPDILARLAALQAFAPMPVSFSAQLSLANQLVAGIGQSIALGIPEPSIAAQIAAVMALVAELIATVAGIRTQLSIVANFQVLLAAAGVHVFAYAGDAGGLGGELTGALALGLPGEGVGPGQHVDAFVLATSIGATSGALRGILPS
jgi:hypothetical protein